MTLIELMVVLAIFLIVASLTIFDYGRFRSNASLQNLSDDVALSIRRAQGFAIGVIGVQRLNSFSYGYGIHFSTSAPSGDTIAGSNKSFPIFADINNNNSYDYASGSSTCIAANVGLNNQECYDLLTITSNDTIAGICPNGNDANCTGTTADIIFKRPNPDAYIYVNGVLYNNVDIEIKNIATQTMKFITVSKIGQISIK